MYLIHPPVANISEAQHKAAYYKYVLNFIDDDLAFIKMCQTNQGRFSESFTIEKGQERLAELLARIYDSAGDTWDGIITYANFKKRFKEDLSSFHCGDCVSISMSCPRCAAEDLYEIKLTCTWNSKGQGAALYHAWRQRTFRSQ